VKCDVRSWDDQVAVFEAAANSSPYKSVDIVIANAGIVGADDLYKLEGKCSLISYEVYLISYNFQTLLFHPSSQI
jgi:NAD(P)-dependent dehydrogenase (short-subunit alcohol dehydrogenase family)